MSGHVPGHWAGRLAAAGTPVRPQVSTRDAMTTYGLLIGLMLATAVLGRLGLGVTRVVFIVGSIVVAHRAYVVGRLALHLEVVLTLFALSPFLRRVVDLHAGYEPSGMMLVAPLLALAVVLPELRHLLSPRTRLGAVALPYLLMAACLLYGWAISAFDGALVAATIAAVKYLLPLLYALCLVVRPDQSEAVLQAASRTFLVIGPVMGLYGVAQYFRPEPWDTFWMTSSRMVSIGLPQPGQVRVFSTMNSPASFACYATCGLLLSGLAPRTTILPPWLASLIAVVPLAVALLLSGVRTAWIAAAVSLVVCLCFDRTRSRAGLLAVCVGGVAVVAILFTSLGDTIGGRLGTMSGGVSEDGSGLERLHDYAYVFGDGQRYLFGAGLAGDSDPAMNALDGQLLMSAVQMGTTVGVLHVIAVVWAGAQAALRVGRGATPLRLVAAATIAGSVAISLLTAIAFGEIGFLYWMLAGVLTVPKGGPPGPAGPGARRAPGPPAAARPGAPRLAARAGVPPVPC